MEQRLILYVLAEKVKKSDKDFGIYKVQRAELEKAFGSGMRNFSDITEAATKLTNRKLHFKKGRKWVEGSWVSAIEVDESCGELIIEFPRLLKPYMLQLKDRFTSYTLENVVYLKSSYSIRLYELLKQYLSLRKRRFDVDELKDLLGIVDEYKLYGHFKNMVLNVAKKQINENTDIKIEFEQIKKGRKIISVQFNIKKQLIKREAQIPELEDPPFTSQDLYDKVLAFGLSKSIADNFFKKYPHQYIEEKLELCLLDQKEGKIRSSAGGYLRKAIEDDFSPLELVKNLSEQVEEMARQKTKKIIQEWKDGNKTPESEQHIEQFYKDAGHPLYRNWRSFV